MMNTFFYENGQKNVFNEEGEIVYDPIEDVLISIGDPNVVLETITTQQTYFSIERPEKIAEKKKTVML